jgi:hypothetical protein
MPVILVTQEIEIGCPKSEAGLDKSKRPYLKNKLKATELGAGVQ